MLKIINPATEAILKEVEEDNSNSIQTKFHRAKKFQSEWKNSSLQSRLQSIKNFRELLVKNKEGLSQTLTSEVGKPISQSRNELSGVLGRIDFFLENTEKVLKEEVVLDDPSQHLKESITFEPLGVIGNISAWNYPYFVGSNVFIPALLTGNSVLYKPSEFATLTGLAITDLLYQSGIPKDAFIPVIGGGNIGAELLKQPLDGIFFTGSYPTGQKIAESASKQLMKVQLELGGKDPIYVCEDVDIAAIAPGIADGAFYNTGQSCCSVERIYVHEKIYDQFIELFLSTVKNFVVGDPTDEKTYIGSLTRKAHLSYLENQVNNAIQKGAKLLCGGKKIDRSGSYFEPTVFIEVNHSMSLMKEETFGPLIGIQKVKNDQEAIELMNDTDYGLTAGVYSKDEVRAKKILSQINSGSVYFNCCDRVSPRLPWSGRKHSGIGSTLSSLGIETFTQPKAWHWRNS